MGDQLYAVHGELHTANTVSFSVCSRAHAFGPCHMEKTKGNGGTSTSLQQLVSNPDQIIYLQQHPQTPRVLATVQLHERKRLPVSIELDQQRPQAQLQQ